MTMWRQQCLISLTVVALTAGRASAAGDQAAGGRAVFATLRCSMCHKVNGSGGKNGPDLSDVGSRRSAAWWTGSA